MSRYSRAGLLLALEKEFGQERAIYEGWSVEALLEEVAEFRKAKDQRAKRAAIDLNASKESKKRKNSNREHVQDDDEEVSIQQIKPAPAAAGSIHKKKPATKPTAPATNAPVPAVPVTVPATVPTTPAMPAAAPPAAVMAMPNAAASGGVHAIPDAATLEDAKLDVLRFFGLLERERKAVQQELRNLKLWKRAMRAAGFKPDRAMTERIEQGIHERLEMLLIAQCQLLSWVNSPQPPAPPIQARVLYPLPFPPLGM